MSKRPALKRQIQTCNAFVWIGALIALLSKALNNWCLWAGIGIVVVAVVCRYAFVRCPHCGHRLMESNQVPSCCPECGQEI